MKKPTMDILALFDCLQAHVTATTCRQCSRIAWAMLVMTGRVTMLGLSRWAGKGGSYRTVQRFFSQTLPWGILFWVFFRQHVYCPNDVYLMVGDEVVATKAGKHTHGLDGFPIVFAKFWWLRNAEGYRLRKTPSLLSDTFAHNELMRQCLLRWQYETLAPGVRPSSTLLARCRIKRRDTVGHHLSKRHSSYYYVGF
jgi:hypothetical protein